MPIAINETKKKLLLARGKLQLGPKGSPTARKEISDAIAAMSDVQRYAHKGKISILKTEEAAARELQEKKAATAAKPQAEVKAAPAPKAEVKAEAAPKAEAKTETKVETDDDEKKTKKRRGVRR